MDCWTSRTALLLAATCALSSACGDSSTTAPDAQPPVDAGPADGDTLDATPDAAPPPYAPDGYCPGGPGCEVGADGALEVGVGQREITATVDETTDIQTVDVNGNGEFDPFEGDEFEDRNGNGVFDAVWIAGFGNARAASGVNDPQWVRAVALRNGDTTLVLASVDCIGYFLDEVVAIREAVSDLEVDYLSVSATHTHEARDTMGIWGVDESVTGASPDYDAFIREQAVAAIREAVADLRAANVQYAELRLRDMPGGALRYVSDSRDPRIFDDTVRVMRFMEAGDGPTIATLVNLASHPQYIGDANQLLSSDFPHFLREAIEGGVAGPDGVMVEGVGGVALFFNGAEGSQVGNERIEAQTWDGEALPRSGMRVAQTVGEQLAYFVLEALGPDGGSVTDEAAELGYRNRQFLIDVENRGFHVALVSGLFERPTFDWDDSRPLRVGVNEPDIQTEVAVVDIGRAQILMVPGELDPMMWIGGADGSFTPAGVEIVDLTREHAPDLSMAPEPPYLIDLMRGDAEYSWFFGLANDEIGYFLPDFDFVLDRRSPYIDEAPGEHYEETVSVGVSGWQRLKGELEALLAWTPDG